MYITCCTPHDNLLVAGVLVLVSRQWIFVVFKRIVTNILKRFVRTGTCLLFIVFQ